MSTALPVSLSASVSLRQTLNNVFSSETSRVLAERCRFERYAYKALVQAEGIEATRAILILSGGVKLSKENGKKRSILDIAGPMELVGGPLILSKELAQVFPVDIESMCSTEVLLLEKDLYHSILKDRDDFSLFLSQQINRRIQRMQEGIRLSQQSVRIRIANFLINRLSKIPNIRMTRSDIAQAVGTTSESAIRIISEWESLGLVTFEKQRLSFIKSSDLHIIAKLDQSLDLSFEK